MGVIKQVVRDHHLKYNADEIQLLDPFLFGFDVNWASRWRAFNTEFSVYFLGPQQTVSEGFGFDHEITLVISPFKTLEPRTMQAAEAFISQDPAKGRVDQSIFFLVTSAEYGRQWVDLYTTRNPQSRIPVVFIADELRAAGRDPWAIRNVLARQLFCRDLFDYKLPLDSDLYFFGRDAIVADHFDAIKRSQNRGLFGLRKTGKTSILYRLKRQVQREKVGAFLYYDCKNPAIRGLHWNELLGRVVREVADAYGISVKIDNGERTVSDCLIEVLRKTPPGKTTSLVFDEIEYISPLTPLDAHWRSGFIPFWQSLWTAQSEVRRLSNTVAGVNPTVVEKDTFDGVQNPMFGIVQPRYLKGFEYLEMKGMVKFFGKRMGLEFEEDALQYLHTRYGGHPLLTRLACSYVHSEAKTATRPILISAEFLRQNETVRDAELTFYCRHVISELKQFYPDEYELLGLLATKQVIDFMEFQWDPDLTRHLREYGLVNIAKGEPPRFAIPVIERYVAVEMARGAGRAITRYIVPSSQRERWVTRRSEMITRDIRELEGLFAAKKLPRLFGQDTFPEPERFGRIVPCVSNDDFVVFINICNRCFVESVERCGGTVSDKNYFWGTIKEMYPGLWQALHRIKVYRNNDLHLELNPRVEAALDEFIARDLEGKRVSQVTDVWFVLQQCVLDSLLEGVQWELDRRG